MFVEVSVYKHAFQTENLGEIIIETNDVNADYVWKLYCEKNEIVAEYKSHTVTRTEKTTLVEFSL